MITTREQEDLLATIRLRCEYIESQCQTHEEAIGEAQEIMRIIDAAQGKNEVRDKDIPF